MPTSTKFAECKIAKLTRKQLRRPTAISCFAAAISLGGCFAQAAELTFDCTGPDANTSLTMKFADGKLSVTDSLGMANFPASLEGDLDKTFTISGAVEREMMMPDPDALDACISMQLAKMGVKVSDKSAFGASRQRCAMQLLPSGTKQTVDVTYSAVATELGKADVLIHLQYQKPSKLSGEVLYINRTTDRGCTTKLIK